MSEPEFEAYLALLAKFLRLTRGQRAEIAAELRDHLEERLAELQAQGQPRDAAIRLALDELGDAAVLAVEFTLPRQARRRRQLMRYSLLSATAIVATFVMAAFYWPISRPDAPTVARAQVQQIPAAGLQAALAQAAAKTPDDLRRRIEEKLSSREFELNFAQASLDEVAAYFSSEDVLDLDVILDQKFLAEIGIDPASELVSLKVRRGALSARSALEMILNQVGGRDLAFAIRDGVIVVTSGEADYENEVYDCRDLIAGVTVQFPPALGFSGDLGGSGAGWMGGGGSGFFQVPPETASRSGRTASGQSNGPLDEGSRVVAQLGGGGGLGGGAPVGGGSGAGSLGSVADSIATSSAGHALLRVIQEATAPEPWVNRDGVGGTITEYDGLVIVHHGQRVHRKIEELLQKMRTVRAANQHAAPANP